MLPRYVGAPYLGSRPIGSLAFEISEYVRAEVGA